MVSIEQLTVEFSARPLFDNVTFLINSKEKLALVGKNGAGKSTLLKILAGLQEPTSGRVNMTRGLTIGYLPQHMIHAEGTTVMEEASKAFDSLKALQERLEQETQELAERTDYESVAYQELIERMTHDTELLQMTGGQNFVGEVEKTLIGLGFLRKDFNRPCSEFSGGWRMRIELAKILLQQPDLLLLDEPTNHLDIESIQWLEQFLANSPAAVVLVSHDRAFLDNVTKRTIEISLGKIYDYNVPYTKYKELRKERHEQQVRAYENQQKMIQDTEEFIERFRYKATKAVQVQSRMKQLEKLERLEVDLEDTARLSLKFQPAPRSGDYPVIIKDFSKTYPSSVQHHCGADAKPLPVIHDVNLTLKRGEKVAFVGKNGEGKSTLVKCIMGQLDYDGELRVGHNVKIGYFAQNQASLLDENVTVFDTIDRVAVGDIRLKIRDILGAFMFGGEASEKKVKVLSGGERSRLAMIRLLLEPVNLLILDEPTNHLDMPSKDVLKDALKAFDGTLIVVSHDREFLDGLVDKVYEFGGGHVREHLGGIYDFLQTKKIASLQELERNNKSNSTPKATKGADLGGVETSNNKQSYEQRKEQQKALKKAERAVQEAEKAVEQLEQEIVDIENQLSDPGKASDVSLCAEYEKKKHLLEQKMYEWELLSEEYESLNATL